MAKATLQECAIAALGLRGETELPQTTHYRVFTRTKSVKGTILPPGVKYFLGDNGAIRIGVKVSQTQPLVDGAKDILIAEGRKHLEGPSLDNLWGAK